MEEARSPIEEVVACLAAAGFVGDGATRTEQVRVPTKDSPVYGKSGGGTRNLWWANAVCESRHPHQGHCREAHNGDLRGDWPGARRGARHRLCGDT